LVELGKFDETLARIDKGIERLKKAKLICFNLKQRNFEPEIDKLLKKAEKIKYYKKQEVDWAEKNDLLRKL